jgi:hypothetical protein
MSRSRTFSTLLAAVALTLTFGAGSASADITTFTSTLNSPNDALAGLGTNFGTLVVSFNSTTDVATFTFTAASNSTNTFLFVDSGAGDVNLNGTFTNPTVGTVTSASTVYPSGGFSTASFNTPPPPDAPFGSGNVSDFGNFSLTTDLVDSTSSPATSLSYSVTMTGGNITSASDVLKFNSSGFDAAAHVVAFSTSNVVNGHQIATGFVGEASSPVVIPEPSTMALAGLGALGFVGYGLRRRLKK